MLTPALATPAPESAADNTPLEVPVGPPTVVICAFALNRLEHTVRCVESVLAQEPAPDQVLVVVDHNEDLLVQLRESLPDEVEVIRNEGGPGLSSARNTAVRYSRCDPIMFLDDDARAHPGWLAGLLAAFEDPEVVGAGGPALAAWEDRQPAWLTDEFLWVVGCSYSGLPAKGEVRNPFGCNMAFRAAAFERAGLFNPDMGRLGSRPLGCEETEFCIRLAREWPEAKIVLVGDAKIDHWVPRDRGRFSYLVRRCFYEGVSKAVVRRLSDARSLETERSYVAQALSQRVASCIRTACVGPGRPAALSQVASVVAGVAAASAGYTLGSARFARALSDAEPQPLERERRSAPREPRPERSRHLHALPTSASVSVVVPTLNEEQCLPWVLERIPHWVKQVVLVDGLSSDATERVARRLRPDITVVHQRQPGKGAALRAGFAAATSDIIVMLDADGSTNPEEIGRFLTVLEAGADFVKGSRHLPGGGSADLTRLRTAGNRALVRMTNLLYGSHFTDLCYGYCAFWRRHLEKLALTATGFEIETQLVLHAINAGLKVREVPSFELDRLAGTSNLNAYRDGKRVLRTLLATRSTVLESGVPIEVTPTAVTAHDAPSWVPAGRERRSCERRRSHSSRYTGPERRSQARRHAPRKTDVVYIAQASDALSLPISSVPGRQTGGSGKRFRRSRRIAPKRLLPAVVRVALPRPAARLARPRKPSTISDGPC